MVKIAIWSDEPTHPIVVAKIIVTWKSMWTESRDDLGAYEKKTTKFIEGPNNKVEIISYDHILSWMVLNKDN